MSKDIEWLREELMGLTFSVNEIGKVRLGEVFELVDKLDEPQKPIIPQFVADHIEKHKGEELNLISRLDFVSEEEFEKKTKEWLYSGSYEEKLKRQHLLIDATRYGYEVEKEPQWVVKIGKGYFSGYDETKVTYVLDNFPGEIARRIVYEDLNEAESDANDIGGEVEEVTE